MVYGVYVANFVVRNAHPKDMCSNEIRYKLKHIFSHSRSKCEHVQLGGHVCSLEETKNFLFVLL